ncbi:MAG: hypothetical protein A2X81_11835 [Desulfobacterales bacterium GWB2_56_26]|nr:MAG: hypothetical protein A2X81_11835 [Desulfobacterales bacterium GWB2_56_26]
MNVSNIGNRPDQAMLQSKQSGDRGKSGIAQELKEKITRIETGKVQEGALQEKGVIGLLQEGHFQGVADVRLRINFHEQLQLMVSQKSGEVLQTESRELMLELESKVQSVGEEFQVTDQVADLLTSFKEEAEGLLGTSDAGSDSSSVIGGLRDAFAGFLASLQSIATADDAEADSGVAGAAAVAGTGASITEDGAPVNLEASETEGPATTPAPDGFTLAVQKLQEWFETEIAALEKTVNDLQVLPDPSEPRGNGVAYERFLETYKGMEAGSGAIRIDGKA